MKRLLASILLLCAVAFSSPAPAAIVGPLPYTLTNGQPADAAQVMADFNKIVNDVNNNVIFPSFTQQSYYATATGSANALIVGVSPTPALYAPGMNIFVKIATTNTGPATINVNSLGLQNIVNLNGSALKSQQMVAGMVAQLVYDGTQFQLVSLAPFSVRQLAVSRTNTVFTIPGAWTFTIPAGVYSVRLEAWGAGGGGGNSALSSSAPGGGAGAYGLQYFSVVPGDVLSGVLGAGGTCCVASVSGTAGGNTTVLLNGVLQGTLGGGSGGVGTAAGNTLTSFTSPGFATGSWAFSASGGPGLAGSISYNTVSTTGSGGMGGSASRGGPGGAGGVGAAGSNAGTPGGGGGGGVNSGGGTGANGWVYIEY